MMKNKQDNNVTNQQVWSTPKLKLNYWDLFDLVLYVMKARQDNDMTNRTGVVYAENEIELS